VFGFPSGSIRWLPCRLPTARPTPAATPAARLRRRAR
jgi:hypothetical protein